MRLHVRLMAGICSVACAVLFTVSGCSDFSSSRDLRDFDPLVAQWERELAGRDLSSTASLAAALDAPMPRMAADLAHSGAFAYQVLSHDEPTVAMWGFMGGAEPLGPEDRWVHACAIVRIENAHFAPVLVKCPRDMAEVPPIDALPQGDPVAEVPWAPSGSADLSHACEASQVEMVVDQFTSMGPHDEARLSARNTGDLSCDIIRTPGLRIHAGGHPRVVSPGGGSQVTRLLPGQSTQARLRWRPTATVDDPHQFLEATLGRSDPIFVQFGYGATGGPFRLSAGDMTVSTWSAPLWSASRGDEGTVTTVAPTCDAGRVTAVLEPSESGSNVDSETAWKAVLRINNPSYLPCRVNRVTMASVNPSRHLFSLGIRETFVPVGGEIRILIGWNTEAEGPALEELMVAFAGRTGRIPVRQAKASIPAGATQFSVTG